MEENERKAGTFVRNPLTMISIFSGVTVAAANAVLPFLVTANQTAYVWFLICYPSALVILFFLTLNFNARALYSPSDYREDKSFLQIMSPRNEINVVAPSIKGRIAATSKKSTMAIVANVENKALSKYETDNSIKIIRDLKLTLRNRVVFIDGATIGDSEYRVFEVKKLSAKVFSVLQDSLQQLRLVHDELDEKSRGIFKVTIIGVVQDVNQFQESDRFMFRMLSLAFVFPVEILFYSEKEI